MTEFFVTVDRHMNDILYVGYKNGQRVLDRIKYRPEIYLPTNIPAKWVGLDGTQIEAKQFNTLGECSRFLKEKEEVSGFRMYGLKSYPEQYINHRYPNGCEDTFDRNTINVTFIDIEVESDDGFPEPSKAEKEITAICLKNNKDNIYHVWGCGSYDKSKSELDVAIEYHKFNDEVEMLRDFMSFWKNNTPDILSGWNSETFDIPYIVNRITKLFGWASCELFSPWGLPPDTSTFMGETKYDFKGVQHLDYLPLFKKLGYTYGTQESYKLDNIANVVLGEKKLDYSEYGNLFTLYKEDFQKFIDYNIKDVQLLQRMEDKLQLITLTLTLGYKANVNAIVSMGSVKIWDTYIFNVLKRKNIIIPFVPRKESDRRIEGAYVKEPLVGMHDWVVNFDLNSLYPSIIRQYNMSPETIITGAHPGVNVNSVLDKKPIDVKPNEIVCATGQKFDSSQKGVFPAIVEKLYNERVVIKGKTLKLKAEAETLSGLAKQKVMNQIASLDNNQMAIKIMLNSLYGAMSNEWFRYYDIRIAEGITITGQATIKWSEKAVNEYLNKLLKSNTDYVIAIDTDSIYVNLGPLVNMVLPNETDHAKIVNFLDSVCKDKLEPLLEASYIDLQKQMNCPENVMVMKRENIASRAVWTGKKRYVMNVYDSEGVRYAEPKIKVTGLESVRSSTPAVCRTMIEDTMKLILRETEQAVQDYVAAARVKFNSLRAEDIAFPRGVSKLNDFVDRTTFYRKGTPMHVRAAIMYNRMIKEKGLEKRYERIGEGDKMKFCYMKKPNPIQENVLAFPMILPPEFDFEKYVDYDVQFEKAYLDPINSLLEVIGWQSERKANLEDFFA